MDNNTLIAEFAAEIRELRRDALQAQGRISQADTRVVNEGISQLTQLLDAFRTQQTGLRAEAIEKAIGLAIDQRATLRNYFPSEEPAFFDANRAIIQPATSETNIVAHRTPPGCLTSLLLVGGGILSFFIIPVIGWIIGPLMIGITLFHPGTKSYHCANCSTILASDTANTCPGCKATFTGREQSGSGSRVGIVIVVLVILFLLLLSSF